MKLFVTAALACLIAAPAVAGDVVVTLNGVEARGGEILASLNTEATFMRGEGEYGVIASGDEAGTITLTFEDVAPGDYALMVMHDENGNGQFDMSPMGMPDEGFTFSNGGAMQGMPTFEVHKFTVGEDGATLTETMFYMRPAQ
ncbi:DUF2141 domain-containing protein [Brevundimonas sp. BAL450]|jgi:uncharacterized protein (DUF2141 family)|uniref:DUF2141 domain-containing protein n=1 Tax=Brevundimonas abyssalis TAR-001 TaxID=1391729 RepID=A0A8E0NCL1_9CAUL|nr:MULTISPECIES: DUF2141 domain-containing protein [Brevundimonas]MBG7616035.1 DUF2141 domain-containing protein [Brevundimonas sp. BAL450]GAD59909.1 hypothetical protein MBEBAB_2159 [Brevundimonas abyssalis TAR-001]